MIFKLAWRNIWRNKRRSYITMASIFFAVFFAIGMRSMQLGAYGHMINSMVRFYTGYFQVHAKGYWEEPNLDNLFLQDSPDVPKETENENIIAQVPRLEGFSLCAYEKLTHGVMLLGIDPIREKQIINIETKLIEGQLFGSLDKSVIIGKGLADYFNVSVADTLVLIGQGRHGVSAAGKFIIAGIAKFANPQLNDNMLYMPLLTAQEYLSANNLISSISYIIPENNLLDATLTQLTSKLDTNQFEIMSWSALLPELEQTIAADSAGGIIMLLILYMVVTFGIFGTVLMMVNERTFEFGVLLSIGMSRIRIGIMMFVETIIVALLGTFAGAIAIAPLRYYFHFNPIHLTGEAGQSIESFGFEPVIPVSIDHNITIMHALIIMTISLIIAFYPIWIIARLNPVSAMRK